MRANRPPEDKVPGLNSPSDPNPAPAFDRVLGTVRRPFPRLMEFAGLLALAVVGQLVLVQVLLAAPGMSTDNPLHLGLTALLGSLVWVAAAVGALRATGRSLGAHLGLGAPRVRRPWLFLGIALLAGLASVVPSSALYDFLKHLAPPSSPDILQMVGRHEPSVPALVLTTIATVLAAPVSEELFFRGLSLGGLSRNYGPWPATFAVSVMFAAIHFDAAKMPSIFLLSTVLCALTLLSGSIWPAIVAHAGYNGLQVAAWLLLLSQGKGSEEATGPGPAATAVSLVLLLLALLAARRLAQGGPPNEPQEGPVTR